MMERVKPFSPGVSSNFFLTYEDDCCGRGLARGRFQKAEVYANCGDTMRDDTPRASREGSTDIERTRHAWIDGNGGFDSRCGDAWLNIWGCLE